MERRRKREEWEWKQRWACSRNGAEKKKRRKNARAVGNGNISHQPFPPSVSVSTDPLRHPSATLGHPSRRSHVPDVRLHVLPVLNSDESMGTANIAITDAQDRPGGVGWPGPVCGAESHAHTGPGSWSSASTEWCGYYLAGLEELETFVVVLLEEDRGR